MFYKLLVRSDTLYVIEWTLYSKSQRGIKMQVVRRFPFLRKISDPRNFASVKERFQHLHFIMTKDLVCNYIMLILLCT